MKSRLIWAAGAFLAITLVACGGGGKGGALPATPNGSSDLANVPPQLIVQDYGQAAMSGAVYVGPVSNASLSANVLVHQSNAQALMTYAQEVQDPSSPNFRHFLTPTQIAAQFGASQSDYQKTAQYFANNGLAVAGWPQRLLLTVSGPQANMQKAFGTTFGIYQKNGVDFIAPMTQPHFQVQLAVDAVGGLVRYRTMHTYIITPPRGANGYSVGYSPSTVRAAFDFDGAYSDNYNGTGIHLGIIGTGPIDTNTANGAIGSCGGHGDCDLNAFAAATNASVATVTEVAVSPSPVATALATIGNPQFPYSSAFEAPPPVTSPTCAGSLPACNPEDGEAQLDTQQAASLAPGSNVWFYLAYNAADCSSVSFPSTCPSSAPDYGPEIGLVESDPEIMQAIADDKVDVLSLSYGGGEPQQGWTGVTGGTDPYEGSYSQLEFHELAVEGVAVFVSSGDNGSAECYSDTTYLAQQCVSYPAGDPSVTSVGGITAPLNAYGQTTAPWVAWGITTFEGGYGALAGSGGGDSGTGGIGITAPSWQESAIGATYREQPDVSMIGDPSTGVAMMQNYEWSGTLGAIGGTSVAAPEMAAMWADVLSACKANPGHGWCPNSGSGSYWRLGNAAPYLYAIYAHSQINGYTPSLTYHDVFYDIVYGDNQMANPTYAPASPIPGASAGPNYDEVSGIGVPFAGHLIQAVTGLTVP
ncbi:MAG TPA: protease pro-enzyme activation domain-containing protein [Candidatus Acidoferrales bacterium]|nr:protease pro-enzyme activation domain-containing protein [Candidatus Acidoferrales bacterium]